MTFGERMTEARKNKGLTQKELAHKMCVSPMRISHYENDNREPDIENIKKISKILEVSPDWLLGLSDKKTTADNNDGSTIVDERIAEIKQAMSKMTDDDFERFYSVYRAIFGK